VRGGGGEGRPKALKLVEGITHWDLSGESTVNVHAVNYCHSQCSLKSTNVVG
jgi:hypothetical protein